MTLTTSSKFIPQHTLNNDESYKFYIYILNSFYNLNVVFAISNILTRNSVLHKINNN